MSCLVEFFKNLFLLKYLPNLGTNAGYGLLFLFGVLTSFHCIGMCGGIAISQCVKKDEIEAESSSNKSQSWLVPSLLYNLGRVISYTIVGGIVGGLGHIISFSGMLKGIVPIIGGLFMVIMAINLLGIFPILRRLNIRMPYFIARKITKGNNYSPAIVGLLSGLMPCGPLQIVQLYALGTKSVVFGALSMFFFSVGTVPILFIFGAINTIINKKFSKVILKVSAGLVLILGVVMIGRGLALYGVSMGMHHQMNMKGEQAVSTVQDNLQTVTTEIKSDSFPPIVVQKGIPVKWIIKANENNLNECNNAITIPKFKIEKKLVVGDNIVEFTPNEVGDIVFTCWMGMIKSKITVVDDLKKVTVNDDTKAPLNKENENKAPICKMQDQSVAAVNKEVKGAENKNSQSALTGSTEKNDKATQETSEHNNNTNSSTNNTANNTTPAVQSFTGYIIDEDCFVAMPKDPGSDTKTCLNMKSCAASGYGIAVSQSDGTYKFYFFDGTFAPNANGVQAQAAVIVKNTSKKNHVTVTVTGTVNGNTKISPDGDGISYPVISVASLVEN
jgi:sulfite exporter TauE/SafE